MTFIKKILIITMVFVPLFSYAQGKYTGMKVYIMPFNVFVMDADVGKPVGYLNDNYVRVNSSYYTATSYDIVIEKFINAFFIPPKPNDYYYEVKSKFKKSDKYSLRYFEPDMIIDFFRYDSKEPSPVQINKYGYFVANFEVYKLDKETMDFLQTYFSSDLISWWL